MSFWNDVTSSDFWYGLTYSDFNRGYLVGAAVVLGLVPGVLTGWLGALAGGLFP